MSKILVYLLFCFITYLAHSQSRYEIYCDSLLLENSLDSALSQEGVTELTGRNDGEVEKYLRSVGINVPAPYCQAGQYWSFDVAKNSLVSSFKRECAYDGWVTVPIPKSGVAQSSFVFAKKEGVPTKFYARKHDLIVWKVSNSWTGHVERVVSVHRAGWVKTIAFNTSSGKKGDQRNGGGVYIRNRNIYHPLGRMNVRGLVGFKTTR